MQGYSAERTAPKKRQKVDEGPMVPGFPPIVDVNWLPGVLLKPSSEV